MKNCKLLVLLLSVCIACHATLQSGNAHFIVKNLKTEYAVTPLGLDVELPRFSWQMESLGAERGLQQTAYQIIVSDEKGNIVWDSGKTQNGFSLNVGDFYKLNP